VTVRHAPTIFGFACCRNSNSKSVGVGWWVVGCAHIQPPPSKAEKDMTSNSTSTTGSSATTAGDDHPAMMEVSLHPYDENDSGNDRGGRGGSDGDDAVVPNHVKLLWNGVIRGIGDKTGMHYDARVYTLCVWVYFSRFLF
jgi:hypothetical protein